MRDKDSLEKTHPVYDWAATAQERDKLWARQAESNIAANERMADIEGKRQALYARDIESNIRTREANEVTYRAQLAEHQKSNAINERIAAALEGILRRMADAADAS